MFWRKRINQRFDHLNAAILELNSKIITNKQEQKEYIQLKTAFNRMWNKRQKRIESGRIPSCWQKSDNEPVGVELTIESFFYVYLDMVESEYNSQPDRYSQTGE